MIQLLYPKFPKPLILHVSSYDDYAYRKASKNKHWDVVDWLHNKAEGGIREIYTVISEKSKKDN